MRTYYTYAHYRQTDGKLFYLGKGFGGRAYAKSGRNSRWTRTVAKHGLDVEILANWPSEQEALDHEVFLIKCFREMGYDLSNVTDGGDGVSGLVHSAASKERMAQAKRGTKQSQETIAKRIAPMRGRPRSPEARAAVTAALRRPEARAKLSLAAKAYVKTDEHKAKLVAASKTQGPRMSALHKGVKKSPEHIQKINKRVVCADTGMEFESVKAAAHWLSSVTGKECKQSRVSMALTGLNKTCRGYTWRYADKI